MSQPSRTTRRLWGPRGPCLSRTSPSAPEQLAPPPPPTLVGWGVGVSGRFLRGCASSVTALRPSRGGARPPPPRGAAASIAAVPARRIHHLGVAVTDLAAAITTYRSLFGGELEHRAEVPDQGVEAASMLIGEGRVELVAPLAADSPVGRFLTKRGSGMHHVAYEVDDLRRELERLAAEGVQLVDTEPHTGLFGLQVAFIHPDAVHGVLSELVTNG